MAFYTLPSVTEAVFTAYISANYTGSYPIKKAFSTDEMALPIIYVKAAEFRVNEYGTHQFRGRCIVSIATQIDDVLDPLAAHDNAVGEVYTILANQEALKAAANEAGNNFQLYSAEIVSFDQERMEDTRAFLSTLELEIFCQTLEV